MSIVDWTPEYTVNNAVLDLQHQKMFDIVNELHRSMLSRAKRQDAVAIAIRELWDYTEMHFAEEERQMQEVNFPGLSEHKAAHEELIRKIQEFEKLSKEGHESIGADLLGFIIIDWLITHILDMDKEFAPYLKH